MGKLYAPSIGAAQAWTPAFSLDTPGTSALPTSTAAGKYWDLGNGLVLGRVSIIASSVTVGTGSGNLRVTGLPHTVTDVGIRASMDFAGITKASYTQFYLVPIGGDTYLTIGAAGSGQVSASVNAANIGTGLRIIGTFWYTK